MTRYNWAPWEQATRDAGHVQPGLHAFAQVVLARYPGTTNVGEYVSRNIGGTGNLSDHAEGRAFDTGCTSAMGELMIAEIGPHGAEIGIDYAIHNRVIYSAKTPDGRPYTGANDHTDHVHWSMTRAASASKTRAQIEAILGGSGAAQAQAQLSADTAWWNWFLGTPDGLKFAESKAANPDPAPAPTVPASVAERLAADTAWWNWFLGTPDGLKYAQDKYASVNTQKG